MHGSLSPDFLTWSVASQSSTIEDDPDWKKPYDYWLHAERLLANGADDHFRIDCISNLKRALDHRIKRLTTLYRFKQIPDSSKPSELLEIFGYYGIARPAMLRKVTEIRNLLEHQHKSPPPTERCHEFVDFTWYFLRSTDALSTLVRCDFLFWLGDNIYNSAYWIELDYGPETDWKCSLRGWVPNEFVEEDKALTITLAQVEVRTVEQMLEHHSGSKNVKERKASDIHLSGTIMLPPQVITRLTTIYFTTP